jgi:hypothetical protein
LIDVKALARWLCSWPGTRSGEGNGVRPEHEKCNLLRNKITNAKTNPDLTPGFAKTSV